MLDLLLIVPVYVLLDRLAAWMIGTMPADDDVIWR